MGSEVSPLDTIALPAPSQDPLGREISLEGMYRSVVVPPRSAGFWRQMRAFAGPAPLISVGHMDPGNWGTDLQGGAQFKFGLLWVVVAASVMAIFLQVSAARLLRGGAERSGPGLP
jgi:manganese transport protein